VLSSDRRMQDLVPTHDLPHTLGRARLEARDTQEALHLTEQALAASREFGDRLGDSTSVQSVLHIYNFNGRLREAVDCFERDSVFRLSTPAA
jgi:hypothetical protein